MIKILSIGNSLAQNATRFLEAMAAADDHVEIILGKANIGGCSLEKHWNLVEQCDLLPDVKPYNFYLTGSEPRGASLREILMSEKWDFITLQQVSNLSWQEETYYPYIDKLYDLVSELAPTAELLLFQTWAYNCDATYFEEFGINQEEMFKSLKKAYSNVAQKLKCRIIPCGEAFQKARSVFRYEKDEIYNFENPKPCELPEQSKSIIAGYHWRTGNTPSGKAELGQDYKHANIKGEYLAGAVWYELMTKTNIFTNSFCPDGISSDELNILKNAAHESVAEYGCK